MTRAADVARSLRPYALGHGLLAKLQAPFRAITAHVLVLPFATVDVPTDTIDAAAAAAIGSAEFRPEALAVLPVAALPGWDAEALGERLFDDAGVFRQAPIR